LQPAGTFNIDEFSSPDVVFLRKLGWRYRPDF